MDFKKLGFVPLIILDDGHGMETAGKRTPKFKDGHFIHENEFNRAVVAFIKKDAERLGFKTLLVAPDDTDTPLKTRTDRANKAWTDYVKLLEASGVKLTDKKKASIYFSEHYNAMCDAWDGSTAEGVGTYYYMKSSEGKRLAECIQEYISQGTPQKNRGVIAANFHVLRETSMYSVLVEAGFMDDPREAELMTNQNFQKETAIQIMMGICRFYGLTHEPETNPVSTKELAIEVAIAAGIITDAKYWTKVLNGEEPINLNYLRQAFLNAKGLKKS